MHPTKRFALIGLILLLSLTACNLPIGGNSAVDENAVNTQVALTVSAAQQANPTIIITATPLPQALPTLTAQPLATQSVPSATPLSATATADTCNMAKFVEDVTIPDDSSIFASSSFVKTWRVMNVGTCTWNTNYALVVVSGDDLKAPTAVNLPASVPPGGTLDLSVTLTAPAADGTYQQNFKLRSDTGLLFGTGAGAAYSLYVRIKVIHFYVLTLMPTIQFGPLVPLETTLYNLADHYCDATWKNNSLVVLPCPGTTTDAAGFVVRNDSPYLQNGTQYNGPTLFTHPQWVDNGSIAGFFPAQAIQNGYRFRATLGCAQGGNACDVKVQLNYSQDGGPVQLLQSWNVKYGNAPIVVDIDLSGFAGHNIAFVLAVSANGTSGQDWMQWVNPRIIK
jgi:hypothetical protein